METDRLTFSPDTGDLKGRRAAITGPLVWDPETTPVVPVGRVPRMPPSRRRRYMRIRFWVKSFAILGMAAGLAGYFGLAKPGPVRAHSKPGRPAAAAPASKFSVAAAWNDPMAAFKTWSGIDVKAGVSNMTAIVGSLWAPTHPRTILLMGTDFAYDAVTGKRVEGPVRSDTMLVLGVDPANSRLTVVSIPRDTRVAIKGRYDKINAAMSQGGPELASKVVSDLLGVKVTNWAQVNTSGLERLVDDVGGVKVFVEKDMRYTDHTAHLAIDLHRGWQTLNGNQAHGYVRFRHDELGDIGRVQRQQQFMRAAAERMLDPNTLLKVPQLLGTVKQNVTTNLAGKDLAELAAWAVRLERSSIRMVMLPGQFSNEQYAASYWLVDPKEAKGLGRRLLGGGAAALAPLERNHVKVTVLNGTTRTGLAGAAARELREAGWNVSAVADAQTRDVARTKVIAQTGRGEWVGSLAKDLGLRAERVDASVGDLATDFTVVVGDDYAAEVGLSPKP